MSAGKQYGRYILDERIAMGGMAEIFRAHTSTQGFEKRVCIKRILPHFIHQDSVEGAEFITMFRDEARTAAKLQHANVVQVFDFGEQDGTLFLAMELVDGADLRRILEHAKKVKKPLLVGECVQIAIDVCRGLHHAHTLVENNKPLGVVHRDISPHNILVSRAGEVKVTDFGIARAAERATHTSTGIVKGKVAYMSPEQAQGLPFDHRLDQFALGVVLWEMLTGLRLFTGENDVQILKKVLACQVPSPSSVKKDIPPALDDIVLRTLREDPAERYADMRQLELALSKFLYSGAVDPETADVRNVFLRVMAEQQQKLEPRKTQVASAAQLEGELSPLTVGQPTESAASASGSGSGPRSPVGSASGPSSVLDPLTATPKDISPPGPEEPATIIPGDREGTSSSGGVSMVFSSSEKNAPAPGGTPVKNPTASRAVVRIGSQEADPNALTAHEPMPALESPPPSLTGTGLPTVEDIELGNRLPQPKSADSTPATRTNVPAGQKASAVERSSKKQPPAPPPDSSSGPAPEYPDALPVPRSAEAAAASEPTARNERSRLPLIAAAGGGAALLVAAAVALVVTGPLAKKPVEPQPPPPPPASIATTTTPPTTTPATTPTPTTTPATTPPATTTSSPVAASAAQDAGANAGAGGEVKAGAEPRMGGDADNAAAKKALIDAAAQKKKADLAKTAEAKKKADAVAKKKVSVLVRPVGTKGGTVNIGGVQHDVFGDGIVFDGVPEGVQTAIVTPFRGEPRSVTINVVATKTVDINFQ